MEPFPLRGRVVTAEERVVVKGNICEKGVWQVFVDSAGLLVTFSSILSCVYTCASLE